MTADVYKVNTLNLFEDLKHTNIKNEEFKQLLSSYQKLASSYIKNNQTDLFKDLNKQKEVIFSYLPSVKKESLKKVAHLQKQLEAEMGNIDEIDTLSTPEKQVQFVKVAYNNGKWTIFAHNLEDAEFTKKETPEAIKCLVNLVDRLDEQEAAYALCHAKKAGLFTMAALPYVRTEEFTNTALEPRYVKDPGTVLGPIDHSWESSVDNTNMPVSRQIAALEDEIQEMDTFKDTDGDYITISSISGDAVITFDNDIFTKEEAEENIRTGYWTKVEADKKDEKIKKLIKDITDLTPNFKEKLAMDEAARRKMAETEQAIKQAQSARAEKLEKAQAVIEPKIRKMASKLDSITFNDAGGLKKCQRLKVKLENGLTLIFSRGVENYQRRVVPVEKVEAVVEKLRKYASPKNLQDFDKDSQELYQFSSKAESLSMILTQGDVLTEESVQNELEYLNKNIKTSQNESFVKNQAYDELDNCIVAGLINFDQYNKLSDYAEINSSMVLDSIKKIKSSLQKPVEAGIFEDAVNKLAHLYNSSKSWLLEKLSFFNLQEKEIKDINEELDDVLNEFDQIIPEGE